MEGKKIKLGIEDKIRYFFEGLLFYRDKIKYFLFVIYNLF